MNSTQNKKIDQVKETTGSYAGKSPSKDSESPLADSGYMPYL